VIAQRGVLQRGIAFLQKPFSAAALALRLRLLLDSGQES
jgi:DNA-binding response OmpR family regulator